jgi:hypothetical protein
MKSIINNSNSLLISRGGFSPRRDVQLDAHDRLNVRAYALFEVFHQNDVFNKRGRTRHLVTIIDTTFISRTSTVQFEVGVLYPISVVCVLIRTDPR